MSNSCASTSVPFMSWLRQAHPCLVSAHIVTRVTSGADFLAEGCIKLKKDRRTTPQACSIRSIRFCGC